MQRTRCPNCDKSIEAETFPKGRPYPCPNCRRVFLPVNVEQVEVAAPPEPAPAPSPASPPSPVSPPRPGGASPANKATRQVVGGPQRVRVTACPKCKALLRLGQGDSKFGKCEGCSHVFVFNPGDVTEMVLPASEIRELPTLQLFDGTEAAAEDDDEPTIMRTTSRLDSAPRAPQEKVSSVLVCERPRIRFEIEKDTVLVGRTSGDLIINDPDVSRRHCSIERSGGRLLVRDLKSTNGTLVNGVRVDLEVLKDGDRLRVGSTELRLVVTSEGEKEKYIALFLDLGKGGGPDDVQAVLNRLKTWTAEDLTEFTPDLILSPATGRGLAIWHWNPLVSGDERRRVVSKVIMAPSSLRVDLATLALPSGQKISPLFGLLLGLARRTVTGNRAKYEGPLLHKAALAVRVESRGNTFVSDLESLEQLTGEKGPEGVARQLHQLGMKAAPAGADQPFVVVSPAEALKEGMQAKAATGSPLRGAASTLESELLEQLEQRCNQEFDAGLAMAFSPKARGGGVLRRLSGGGADSEAKVPTKLYSRILGGSSIHLGKEDVSRWMELLRTIGRRYAEALRAERERARQEDTGSEVGWKDLAALQDADLLAASEAAILFRAAFFRGNTIQDADLTRLSGLCSEALAASVPSRYEPVPLPTLDKIYAIFRDAVDDPSDAVEARSFFEFFVLLSLAELTRGIFDEALRRAQEMGDANEVASVKENYGIQLTILKGGLGTMSRIVGILKLMPSLRAVGQSKTIFDRHQLPAYDLIP